MSPETTPHLDDTPPSPAPTESRAACVRAAAAILFTLATSALASQAAAPPEEQAAGQDAHPAVSARRPEPPTRATGSPARRRESLPLLPSDEGVRRIREGHPLDLNLANAADLKLLPGIGATLAERVVDHRERHGSFRSVADLGRVSGIGPRTIERLSPLVGVEAPELRGVATGSKEVDHPSRDERGLDDEAVERIEAIDGHHEEARVDADDPLPAH